MLVNGLCNSLLSKICDNILGTRDTVYPEVEHGILEGPLSVWPSNSALVCHAGLPYCVRSYLEPECRIYRHVEFSGCIVTEMNKGIVLSQQWQLTQ